MHGRQNADGAAKDTDKPANSGQASKEKLNSPQSDAKAQADKFKPAVLPPLPRPLSKIEPKAFRYPNLPATVKPTNMHGIASPRAQPSDAKPVSNPRSTLPAVTPPTAVGAKVETNQNKSSNEHIIEKGKPLASKNSADSINTSTAAPKNAVTLPNPSLSATSTSTKALSQDVIVSSTPPTAAPQLEASKVPTTAPAPSSAPISGTSNKAPSQAASDKDAAHAAEPAAGSASTFSSLAAAPVAALTAVVSAVHSKAKLLTARKGAVQAEQQEQQENKSPATESKLPTKENKPAATDSKLPTKENKPPSTENKLPTRENKPPSTESKLPTKENKPAATDSKLPTKENKPPSTENKLPTKENKPPSNTGLSGSQKQQAQSAALPTTEKKPPAKENKPPSSTGSSSDCQQQHAQDTAVPAAENVPSASTGSATNFIKKIASLARLPGRAKSDNGIASASATPLLNAESKVSPDPSVRVSSHPEKASPTSAPAAASSKTNAAPVVSAKKSEVEPAATVLAATSSASKIALVKKEPDQPGHQQQAQDNALQTAEAKPAAGSGSPTSFIKKIASLAHLPRLKKFDNANEEPGKSPESENLKSNKPEHQPAPKADGSAKKDSQQASVGIKSPSHNLEKGEKQNHKKAPKDDAQHPPQIMSPGRKSAEKKISNSHGLQTKKDK